MSSVNHPTHYATKSGVEVIEITRHLSNNLGNAVKYMLRAGKKGDAKEDMAKAAWYLVDEVETSMWDETKIKKHLRWKCSQVAVTCMAGRNRSGLVLAKVLTLHGFLPLRAIELIRKYRPSALTNGAFNKWILSC